MASGQLLLPLCILTVVKLSKLVMHPNDEMGVFAF